MPDRQEQLRSLVHRWFAEVWNSGRSEVIHEMLGPECMIHGVIVDGTPVKGPDEFAAFYKIFRGTFPDVTITVLDTASEGDKIAVRCRVQGTHLGSDLGIPASQRKVDFTGMVFARFDGETIAEAWNNFDFLSMYQQVGMMDPQSARLSEQA